MLHLKAVCWQSHDMTVTGGAHSLQGSGTHWRASLLNPETYSGAELLQRLGLERRVQTAGKDKVLMDPFRYAHT